MAGAEADRRSVGDEGPYFADAKTTGDRLSAYCWPTASKLM